MVHAMFTNPYSQLAIPEVGTAALQGTVIGNACSQSVSKTSSQGEKTHDCDPPLSLLLSILLPFSPPSLLPSPLLFLGSFSLIKIPWKFVSPDSVLKPVFQTLFLHLSQWGMCNNRKEKYTHFLGLAWPCIMWPWKVCLGVSYGHYPTWTQRSSVWHTSLSNPKKQTFS